MADAVVFDTSVLPVNRDVSGVLWLSIRKLCAARNVVTVLPELVIHESVNLRRERYLEAQADFLTSVRKLARYFDVEPIYVPDVEEICSDWEQSLRATFTVQNVDGGDAAEALRREAGRVRPARAGRGARDSAIWLTVMRLSGDYDTVYFVSRNTSDFGDAREDGVLHQSLADEASAAPGTVVYMSSVDDFLEALATAGAEPAIAIEAVADVLRFDVRDEVYTRLLEAGHDVPPEDLDAAALTLAETRVLRSYEMDASVLALIEAPGAIPIGDSADGNVSNFRVWAWLELETEGGSIETGELVKTVLT